MAAWMEWQSTTVQSLTQGEALSSSMGRVSTWVEENMASPAVVAIFCADGSGKLELCAGKLPVGEGHRIAQLQAGASADTKKQVTIPVKHDSFTRATAEQGKPSASIRFCTSTPLLNRSGILRGTLEVYHQPDALSPADLGVVAFAAHTALLLAECNTMRSVKPAQSATEEALRHQLSESEGRFQNLVREASVGIIVLSGEDLVVEVVNEMYGRLIDRAPEELLFKPLFNIIPEAEAAFRPLLDGVRTSGRPLNLYEHPYSVKSLQGEIRGFLNIVYQPYREANGQVTGVMVLCHEVTGLVESRKRLEESEAHFRDLVMQAPVAIAVIKGPDLRVHVANDCYLEIVGKRRQEFEGAALFEALPETRDALEPIAGAVVQSGQTRTFNEFELFLHRDGKLEATYFNSVWKPYRNLEGKVDGFIVVAHEVTGQVLARRKQEQNERDIRAIIESAPFPIGVYVGPEMRIQFANQSIIDVWGKGSDIIGKRYAEVLPELANQKIYDQLDEVYRTGQPYHAKNQRVDLLIDNELRPFFFNYSFTPLFDASGAVYGVMNTAADVTELALAYNKLEESEERAILAIEASGQGTFHIDLKTNELIPSSRMAQIFDVDGSTERSRYISAIHPDDLPVREAGYIKAFETSILDYEGRLVRKDGSITWIRVKGKMYFDDQHQPHRLVGIVQDITEQKNFSETLARKVEERTAELEDANRQLVAINDELQQFAYVSSHDLQEPLRKIRIFSDMLGPLVGGESEAAGYLKKITSAAERMTGLIKGLLEYSRVANAQVRFEKVDLNDLLSLILVDYELLITQKEATIHIDPLPQVEGVLLQLNQLFFNLLGNALKFTRRGVQPRIEIRAEHLTDLDKERYSELDPGKGYVAITVCDNGIGFEQEFAAKIFTVFQRLNDLSSFGGYGIGLALCKKVVQTHKGLIFAEGALKRGATFTIILPLQQ